MLTNIKTYILEIIPSGFMTTRSNISRGREWSTRVAVRKNEYRPGVAKMKVFCELIPWCAFLSENLSNV